jgi:hypothetical protein
MADDQWSAVPSAARRRPGIAVRVTAAGSLAAVLALAGGCLGRERICRDGEYPAKAVGNATGRTCVAAGQPPPAGYVRYPPGKEPVHVDDAWDRYWRTVVVDEHGTVTGSSAAEPGR